ncbi:unnamed protein product [Microthlaspi erraticum]|uniref:Retrotransposon gag domain-containing protein n=1 Tax=Microthlaspi erraticum TaxID=1685480 RepID=A0A6D2KXF3_9BRAS|nr:unnamed protein product [Microthlaspi erraticum]
MAANAGGAPPPGVNPPPGIPVHAQRPARQIEPATHHIPAKTAPTLPHHRKRLIECALQKINNVTEDGLKLRLFPFSLGGKALAWESSIQPEQSRHGSNASTHFLAKFFPTSRTAQLRNDIASFTQLTGNILRHMSVSRDIK